MNHKKRLINLRPDLSPPKSKAVKATAAEVYKMLRSRPLLIKSETITTLEPVKVELEENESILFKVEIV